MNSPYALDRTSRRWRVTPYSEWIFISLLFQKPRHPLRHVLCGSRPHNLSLRHIFVSAAPRYDIEGKLQVGEMVLSGVDHAADGETLVRRCGNLRAEAFARPR